MVSWQLKLLATLTIIYHLLKREIVVYLVNLCHLLHSIPMDVCSVSQLERGCYVSFRELILSCSIFEKIDPSRVSFSPGHVGRISQSKTSRQDGDRINVLMKGNLDREDCVRLRPPSSYPTLESRDEILV